MIIANRGPRTKLAFGTAASAETIIGADRFLVICSAQSGLQSWTESGKKPTEGQQESPQHVSPGPQNVSEQQVEFSGMQKGAM